MEPRHLTGRHCARCTYPMEAIAAHPVWLDHCYRCGGTFIPRGHAGHGVGAFADPSKWKQEAYVRAPLPSPLMCPCGQARMLSYLLRSEGREVEIDGCNVCGGMWLDYREAQALTAITTEVHHDQHHPGSAKGKAGVVATYVFQILTQLPIEVHNPIRRRPILIWSLVGLNILVFMLQVAFAMRGGSAMRQLSLIPADVLHGRIYQLVTHAFLHGGFMHIAGNLYMLWIFGDNVEDRLGRARFAALYLLTAVAGGLAFMATHWGKDTGMVGASGAISGLMGAYLVLFPRTKLWFNFLVQVRLRAYWYMAIYVALNLLLIFAKTSGIAWEAHLGGFAAGVVLALVLRVGTDDDAMPLTVRQPPPGRR